MPLSKLSFLGQGTNVIPVKGTSAPATTFPTEKPFSLNEQGRLPIDPALMPQQPTPSAGVAPVSSGDPEIDNIRQILGSTPGMPGADPDVTEIRNILAGRPTSTVKPPEKKQGFVGNLLRGIGQSALQTVGSVPTMLEATGKLLAGQGDQAAKTIREGSEFTKLLEKGLGYKEGEIAKPVGIGVPIQEQKDRGIFGRETLDVLGKGLELGSYGIGAPAAKTAFTGTKGALMGTGKQTLMGVAKQGAKYEGIAELAGGVGIGLQDENATPGSVALTGLVGVGLGVAAGLLFPLAGAGAKGVMRRVSPKIAEMAKTYDSALGTLRFTKTENQKLQQRATAMGLQPMTTGELLLREQVPILAAREGDRVVYKTMEAVDQLQPKIEAVEKIKKDVLATKPEAQFDLGLVKDDIIQGIDKNLLEADKIRIGALIDNIFEAEMEARGRFVSGDVLDSIKKGLQKRGNYAQETLSEVGSTQAFRDAASLVRKTLEKGYDDLADLKLINYVESQYINAIDILTNLDSRPVAGGKLSRDLAGIVGTIIGAGSKVPIVGPFVGKEFAEAARDYAINPQRITEGLVKKIGKKKAPLYGESILDKVLKNMDEYQGAKAQVAPKQQPLVKIGQTTPAVPLIENFTLKNRKGLEQSAGFEKSFQGLYKGEQSLFDPKVFKDGLKKEAKELKQYAKEARKMLEDEKDAYIKANLALVADDVRARPLVYNVNVYKAVKNSPFYKKEGGLADWMGSGLLIERNGHQKLIQGKDFGEYVGKGWKKNIEIDSLAAEAGFESGEEFLSEVLKNVPKMYQANKRLRYLGHDNAFGAMAGIELETDDQGNYTGKIGFDPAKGIMGLAGMTIAKRYLPNIKKAAKEMTPEIAENMERFIDYTRLKKPVDLNLEEDASRMAEDLGLRMGKTNKSLADQFDEVLARFRQIGEPKLGKESPSLYHGTAKRFDKFDSAMMRGGNQGKSVYLTDNVNIAKYHSFGANDRVLEKELGRMPYSSEKKVGEVLDVQIAPNAKIKTLDYTPTQKEVDKLKAQGYDGITFVDEVALEEWNPKLHGEYPKKGSAKTTMIFDPEKAIIKKLDDTLIQEAKKFKSADEFVKDVMDKSNIGLQGEIKTIPVNRIKGTDYIELDEALSKNKKLSIDEAEDIISATEDYSVGQKVKYPIEVIENSNGTYNLIAGNHRLAQKLINEEVDVIANIANRKGISTTSQLTDIWNKANNKTAQ